MRVGWKGWLGLAVTVFLLWWVFRGEDPQAVWNEIAGVNLSLLLLSVAIATSGFFIRAVRWRLLLAPLHPDIRLSSSFAAVAIGFMANNVIGARAGELVRPYALSRLEPVPMTGAFGALVVERLLDSIALLAFLLLAMASPSFPGAQGSGDVSRVVDFAMATIGILLVAILILVSFPRPIIRGAELVAARLPARVTPKVIGALESFLEGFDALRDPKLLIQAVLWTVFFWCWHSLSFWVGFRAFGIEVDFMAALFVNSIVGFMVALPALPGFFGTFHYAVTVGLSDVYGVDGESALAFAFGYHLGGFIPITAIGLWYAWRLGISFRQVSSEVRSEVVDENGHDRA